MLKGQEFNVFFIHISTAVNNSKALYIVNHKTYPTTNINEQF